MPRAKPMKQRKSPRHAFHFEVDQDGQKPRVITAFAKVTKARRVVELVLRAEHVKKAIAGKGVGNTQKCSMAVCAKTQKDAFPHPTEGFIDWQYSTAYVVTKLDKKTGLPSECVAYEHDDDIAKLNDSKDGQYALLRDLEAGGPRMIRLRPPKPRRSQAGSMAPQGTPPRGTPGPRNRPIRAQGAKLRYATAMLGGAP